MSNILVNTADIIRNREKFEIDGCINPNDFFKAKFENDKKAIQRLHDNLYKTIKK